MADQATATLLVDIKQALARFSELERAFRDTTVKMQKDGAVLADGADTLGAEYEQAYEQMERAAADAEVKIKQLAQVIQTMGHRADIKLLNLGEAVKELDRYKERYAETIRSLQAARQKQIADETAVAVALENRYEANRKRRIELDAQVAKAKEEQSTREFQRLQNTEDFYLRSQAKYLRAEEAVKKARESGAKDEDARLKSLATKAAAVYIEAQSALARYEKAKSEYRGTDSAELAKIKKEVADLWGSAEKEFREYKAAVDSIGKDTPGHIKKLERDAKSAYDAMTTGAVRVAKQLHGVGAAVDDVAARERRAAEQRAKHLKQNIDGYAELARSVQRLYSVVVLGAFGRIGVEAVKANLALERLQVTLTAVHRDAEGSTESLNAGAEAYAFVRSEVERLKIPLLESVEGFTKLTAASKGTALEGEGVRAVFSSVSEVARTLQLNAEQTRLAFYALQQMMSKGKVTTEELRRQFAEQIPGAFEAAARAMNVSTVELDSMLRKGQIVSSEFLPKFAEELRNTFGPGLKDAIGSRVAQIQDFNNALLEAKAAFAEGFVEEVVRGANTAGTAMRDNLDTIGAAGQGFGLAFATAADQIRTWEERILAAKASVELLGAGLKDEQAQAKLVAAGYEVMADALDKVSVRLPEWTGLPPTFLSETAQAADNLRAIADELRDRVDPALKDTRREFAQALAEVFDEVPGAADRAVKSLSELVNQLQLAGKLGGPEAEYLARQAQNLASRYEKVTPELKLLIAELKEFAKAASDPALDKARAHADALAEATAELGDELGDVSGKLQVQSEALILFYSESRRAGTLTAEQLAAVKAKARELFDEFASRGAEIPDGFEKWARALGVVTEAEEKLAEQQKKTAETAAREHERAAEQIAAAYGKMSDSVADIFAKLRDQLRPTDDGAEDQKRELADLQAEYDELRNAPTSSTEEFNRINELDVLIQQKQKDVATAITESVGKVREGVADSFREMVLGNDSLIQGLALLPQASQNAFVGLVENFNNAAEAGTVTEGRLKNFGNTVATIFEQAGINVQGLREQLSGTATIADELIAKIRDAAMLRDQTGKPTGSGGASTEDAKETAQAAGQIVRSQQAIGTAVAGSAAELAQQRQMVVDLADITDKSSVGVDYFTEATEKQSVSLAQLAEETKKARDYTREYNNELVEVDSATTSAAVAAVQAARATTEREISTENLNDALAGFAARQNEVNSSVIGSIQGSNQATEALQEQTEATTTTTEATAEAVEGSIEWSLAQKKVKEETDKSAKSLEDLGKNMEGIFGEKTLEGMDKVIQKMRDELLPVCRELRDCLNEIS
jgi:tape measure domain-containing protein